MALGTSSAKVAKVTCDEFVYSSNSNDSDFKESFRTIPDDNSEIFNSPPSVSSQLELQTESIEENENNENSNEPNSYGLQETPIYNYSSETEIKDDFCNVWYWTCLPNEEDIGPEYEPFIGKQQLLLDLYIKEPDYFFNEIFSPSMFNMIAKSTKRYATQKLQLRGMFFILFYPEQEINVTYEE